MEFSKQLISDELANREAIQIARKDASNSHGGTAQSLNTLPVRGRKTGTAQLGRKTRPMPGLFRLRPMTIRQLPWSCW